MDLGLEALTSASAAGRDLHRPEFFKLSIPTDRERLREVLKRSPGIQVFDELHSQLTELVRSLNPSVKYTKPELEAAAKAHLGSAPSEEYGLWVFYPWSNRVLHLLNEAEFTLVRTDRNRNKITRDEQARLALVKVGVIGLSVGQSVALTMAQERSFGEIRLADFDTLELSNLNRIRSGTHHLGILKTVNVAREIAEIDPFLKVILFNDGLTRENVDRFFTEGGKLDIVVEECDSVDVKIIARQKAKELRVPVVMDTSDRGMLDVERFDLEPDRPILHGLIDHLDPNDAAKAKTNEEKLPFVLPILNIDTLSKRMKASMLEIESSVTTWPQLATSVVLGGAVAGDVCRRIMLGQFQSSGRWFVDLEEVITDHAPSKAPDAGAPSIQIPATLTMDDMVRMAETISSDSPNDKGFSQAQALEIVRAGCLAPSGGNSQPWKFLLHNGQLFVFMDPARSFSTIDPGLVFARLGIGACIENMRLKANAMGLGISIELQPAGEFPHLLAVMTFGEGSNNDRGRMDPLSDFIEQRCTNRRRGDSSPIAADQLELLRASVAEIVPDALVQFASDRKTMAEVGTLCGQAERVRMLNPISHWDMFSREMRWNAEEAKRSGDGVDVRTLELSLSDRTGISVAADPDAIAYLRQWEVGRGMEKLSRGLITSSAAIALVRMPDLSPENAVHGGRAVQRLWLKATELNIAAQPISAPIFMGVHERYDREGIYSTSERSELSAIHSRLLDLFGVAQGEPLFMLRLDHADPPMVRSLRRPISEFFHIHQPVVA